MIHNRMCVTHNNIARGDSLIAFASLTISAKSIKIRLSHNLSNLFCENCAFFVKWQWVKSHIRKSSQQSYLLEKIILFLGLLLFFPIFFYTYTWQSYYFFMLTYFRKRYVFFFKKEIIYFLCILLCFPKELFGFFWNIIIKKLWRGRRSRDQNGKMRLLKLRRKKCTLSLKLIYT